MPKFEPWAADGLLCGVASDKSSDAGIKALFEWITKEQEKLERKYTNCEKKLENAVGMFAFSGDSPPPAVLGKRKQHEVLKEATPFIIVTEGHAWEWEATSYPIPGTASVIVPLVGSFFVFLLNISTLTGEKA